MSIEAETLFLNIWHSKAEEVAQPGDADYDQKKVFAYWGKIWIECKELATYLKSLDALTSELKDCTKSP